MESLIRAVDLRSMNGWSTVLRDVNIDIGPGKVVGLIGPNGSGKTTLLKSLVGFNKSVGNLLVLNQDPRLVGANLFNDVFFIPDSSSLPGWMKINELFSYLSGVHKNFDLEKATLLLDRSNLDARVSIGKLSKGMAAQLYIVIATAVDSRLLILDEPTLGLDLLLRKKMYKNLLQDYLNSDRSVLISTHEIVEIEEFLTDVIFLNNGEILLSSSMEVLAKDFLELKVDSEHLGLAQALPSVGSRACPGGRQILYRNIDRAELEKLGEVKQACLSDIFLSLIAGVDKE